MKYTNHERGDLVEQFTVMKDEQGSGTNVAAVIYDELFMSMVVTNSNAREKGDEIPHAESRKWL